MPHALSLFIALMAGYLVGSIPTGVLLARAFGWPDPRLHGSGHTGALNVSRRVGRGALALVLALDALKGAAAIGLAGILSDHPFAVSVTGIAAVAGHCWPVWLGFAGGMGLGTTAGAMLAAAPLSALANGLALLVIRLLIVRHTPRAVIATSALVGPILLLLRVNPPVLAMGIGIAVVVALRHTVDWNRAYASNRLLE